MFKALAVCGVSFEAKLELLIADPQYNIRRKGGRPDSEHDVFTKQDIADMLDLSEANQKPGGYGYVLGSTLNFAESAYGPKWCEESVPVPGTDGDYREKRESFRNEGHRLCSKMR